MGEAGDCADAAMVNKLCVNWAYNNIFCKARDSVLSGHAQ